jgi:WD40 repeat protein
MNVGTRRIIYIFFIIVFLIIAPILILYAHGYRYNFKKFRVQKTGIIFLTSKQKDLSVYINGKLYPTALSQNLSINDLLPDEYLIRVEKEGYHSWQKKLNVYSAKTTFTNNVILLGKEPPLNLVSGKIGWADLSPDKEKLVYLLSEEKDQELWLLNLENNKSSLFYQFTSTKSNNQENITWAPSLKKILIDIKNGKENNYLVLNVERPEEIISLGELGGADLGHIKWDESSDNILYGVKKNKLYQIDLATPKIDPIIDLEIGPSDNFLDYKIINRNLYYIKTDKTSSFILNENLNDQENLLRIKLARALNYAFIEGNDKFLTILDKENQKLFLINTEFFPNIAFSDKSEELIDQLEAKNALWQPGSNRLLYYNDFEIWIYDLDSNKKEIINRYSEEIEEVIWHPNYQYLAVLIGSEIKVLEISETGKNIIDLVKLEDIKNISVDALGEKLYFIGQIDKKEGLYELGLQ